MKYILFGVLGFGLVFLFDWLSLRRLPLLKPLTWVVALALVVYAVVKLSLEAPKLSLPTFTIPLGFCLLIVSTCLLVYSLFIEIPFVATYVSVGTTKLVTSGTYALVRHPWVIWLSLAFVSLFLIFPSTTLLLATLAWLGLNILHVCVQDRFLFPKMFPDYVDYQRRVPFLIPNRASLKACLRTLGKKVT